MKRVLCIIPTYNEVDNIQSLTDAILRVGKNLAAFNLELLFIDDLSPDGTAAKIQELQSKYQNIYLLLGKKKGLGAAYKRGISYGLSLKNYDYIITIDADLSHDPAVIPKLLAALDTGFDVAIGSRYIPGGACEQAYSQYRLLESKIANTYARHCINSAINLKDITSGYRAIKVSQLKSLDINAISANGYIFQVSLLNALLLQGSTVTEIPITFKKRQYGSSKVRMQDILEFIFQSFKMKLNSENRQLSRKMVVNTLDDM